MIDVLPAGFTRLMAQASLSTGIAEPKLACWFLTFDTQCPRKAFLALPNLCVNFIIKLFEQASLQRRGRLPRESKTQKVHLAPT